MAARVMARLVALVMVFTAAPLIAGAPAVAAPGFSDVPPGTYYTLAVEWLVDQGITTGTTSTTFSPDDPVTRAQMAAFLWRFGYRKGGSLLSFSDVPSGVYFDTAVRWLLLHGITTGTSPTTYSPWAGVTRAEMAVFLWRYAGKPAPSAPAAFSDVPPGIWFADAVAWLVEQGVTIGTTPTTFSPDRAVNRAEMATFLWRYAGEPAVGSPGVNRNPYGYDCALQTSIPAVECEALVAIKHANPGATLTGWIVDPNPATWSGVTATSAVVTQLRLWSLSITSLPASIGNLTNLFDLQLGDNQLTSLPASIGNLTNVRSLGLWGNQLTSLPSEIGDLTGLQELDVDDNQLTSLPTEIENLTALTLLSLGSNQLTTLPLSLWDLTDLQNLNLNGNRMPDTTLPAAMMNLTSLTAFSIRFQSGCLTAETPALAAWLTGYDAAWNIGCP